MAPVPYDNGAIFYANVAINTACQQLLFMRALKARTTHAQCRIAVTWHRIPWPLRTYALRKNRRRAQCGDIAAIRVERQYDTVVTAVQYTRKTIYLLLIVYTSADGSKTDRQHSLFMLY